MKGRRESGSGRGREAGDGRGGRGRETDREIDIDQLFHPFLDSWVDSCMCFDPDQPETLVHTASTPPNLARAECGILLFVRKMRLRWAW